MERSKTIGIVIFRREGKAIRYLLLHKGGQYWNVPKGRPEAGENELETALRELREESGITEVKRIPDFREEYEYDFTSEIKDGQREQVYKTAIFFLGEVMSERVTISHEHLDFGWFDYETALKRMYYQPGRELLKKVHQFLLNQQVRVL